MAFLPQADHGQGFVYMPIPVDRVEDVYQLLGGAYRAADSADAPLIPEIDLDHMIETIYTESEQKFRDLLVLLAQNPGKAMTTERIAAKLELPRGPSSLAGMLGAYGRRANNRYKGFWPFDRMTDALSDRQILRMDRPIAEVVLRVYDDDMPF